jgi:hypothetical protein
MESPINLHEAGVVKGGHDFGARLHHTTLFLGKHSHGDPGVLDSERSAEATALFLLGKRQQSKTADGAKQPHRSITNVQHSQRMTGRMIGNGVGEHSAYVIDTQFVDEQFGELENSWQERPNTAPQDRIVLGLGDQIVVLAHHRNTRSGGDTYDVRIAKDLYKASYQRNRFAVIAGVVMHLSTTSLLQGEVNRMPEPLEHPRDANPGLGK